MDKYDTSWLLISDETPDDIVDAVTKIECVFSEADAYVYFVNPKNPNKEGSEWHFSRSHEIKNTTRGCVVLDILKDGRIGGIEFVDKINLVGEDNG